MVGMRRQPNMASLSSGVCVFSDTYREAPAQNINNSSFDTSTSINTYINLNIKPPYIYTYVRIHIHVSGLLISLWGPANSPFVRDKYVRPTGKRLHADCVQKRKHVKNSSQ